jgi:hypothetical protein
MVNSSINFMKINQHFKNKDDRFWSLVKLVSESTGYSERIKHKGDEPKMKRYDAKDIEKSLSDNGINNTYCFNTNGSSTNECKEVLDYLNFRAELIETDIKNQLLDRDGARVEYLELLKKFPKSKLKIQMNKQKGDKRHPSYLVNMVNIIAESVLGANSFDDDPMRLGLIFDKKGLIKTLCRRMDGAYPSTLNPKILWEVKEYYGTTTFGSRIADGVYETMLVGEELTSLHNEAGIKVNHVLFVDDYYTWWTLGRSYLCRLVDLVHGGYADQIFFGREVVDEWGNYLKQIATK